MLFYSIMFLWIALDQLSKYYIRQHFILGQSVPIIDNIFHLTYILNKGAAFGILNNQRIFFLLIVIVLLLICIIYRKRISQADTVGKVGLALLLGGALGNAIDRYEFGAVTDFFDFRIWPIFNVADVGICVGVALLAWHLWRQPENKTGEREGYGNKENE